jgi:hypothetical protein
LMRDRNLDAAQLLELVWQYALIEQLVPILDPGDAERLRVIRLTTRGSGAPVRLAESISSRVWGDFSLSSM